MTIERCIEEALEDALRNTSGQGAPPIISKAIHYAVFPGGARTRPRLLAEVARACGSELDRIVTSSAAALELMHCASLVHDDLPCFDNAEIRRGKPSVHRKFGEPIAVLTGDAMIVLAFETLAAGTMDRPHQAAHLISSLVSAVGMPGGIIAGQAWEVEPSVDLAAYQRAKTGSLFVAAVRLGAIAAGENPERWAPVGMKLGEAYQVADDLHDALSSSEEIGKPVRQDAINGRPNAVVELGVARSVKQLRALLQEAVDAVPSCSGRTNLRAMIEKETSRFLPRSLAQCAA